MNVDPSQYILERFIYYDKTLRFIQVVVRR